MKLTLKKIIAVFMSAVILSGMNLVSFAESENSWKNKIDEEIYEKITDTDTKVPVYIWLTDVDHEDVIADTEETLGYGEEDLAVIDENFSDELAISVSSLSETDDETVSDELEKYLKKTEKKRKAEKEKTDKYIEKKREKYRDKYNEKSKDFLEKAKISDEDIIFRSQYAPMIIAELTEKQIKKVAKSEEVCEINFYEELQWKTHLSLSELKESTGVDIIHDIGLTGAGVKVGVHDTGFFDTEYEEFLSENNLPDERFHVLHDDLLYSKDHIIYVTRILCGNNGVAPDAECYVISSEEAPSPEAHYQRFEILISNGVSLINYSKGSDRGNDFYHDEEKWIDHISTVHNVSFVVSAGNEAGKICIPAMAFNAITVGGFDNNSTTLTSDDTIYNSSNYNNGDGCEKPDLLAQAYVFGEEGTSLSAPYVSGVIALMLELRPSLAAYPHIVKAILLASCHHKATSTPAETMSPDGITDKQGAGVVDIYRALSIAGRGNYGVRSIPAGTINTDIRFTVPSLYGATGMNVSIAWLKNNTVSGDHNVEGNANAGANTDLNLTVLKNGTTVGTSELDNSSTEMVYITSPTAAIYTARINREDSSTEAVKVAYAWSFDEEQFQYSGDFEGVFYLKNKQSGYYLDYLSSTGYTQKPISVGDTQKWVVWQSSNGYYTIKPFSGNTECIDINTLVSGKYYSINFESSDVADISIQMNNDGSVTVNNVTGGSQYLLSVLNNSTSANAQIVWKKFDSISDVELSQCWYLEPICYQVGDVDMNGQIAAADSRTALNYSAGSTSYGDMTNIKEYLTDANSDGLITAADSRLILRFASGLE